jgi:hypothetical protein
MPVPDYGYAPTPKTPPKDPPFDASDGYRMALTENVFDPQGPGLAALAGLTVTDDMRNYQIWQAIAIKLGYHPDPPVTCTCGQRQDQNNDGAVSILIGEVLHSSAQACAPLKDD